MQYVVHFLPHSIDAIFPLIRTLGFVLTYYVFVRVIEKRSVFELSASGAGAELGKGAFIGAALFTVTISVIWGLGFYRITGMNNWAAALPTLTDAVVAGVLEEIIFRGVLFRLFEEWAGTWPALVLSAFSFGMIHLKNPNASLISTTAIVFLGGIMLAAAFMLTRRLWLPIGIHFAWNFTQGGIFGVAVSGIQMGGLLQSGLSGPTIISGGPFGAESSIIAVMLCLGTGVYMLRSAYKKGNFVKPSWRR
jgi:uncharacterized protein